MRPCKLKHPISNLQVSPKCLDSWSEWNFWRFDLTIPVSEKEMRVDYSVDAQTLPECSFYIAGARCQPIC